MDKRQELLVMRSNLELARELGYKRYNQIQNTERPASTASTFDTAYINRLKSILNTPKFDVVEINYGEEMVR